MVKSTCPLFLSFNNVYPIDSNKQLFSLIIAKWKRPTTP